MSATTRANDGSSALPTISDETAAFSHIPEHGFSLFLSNRTKTIHFVRHAEGRHNEVNMAYGDDTPVVFSTPGSWELIDACLTDNGIQQCVKARGKLLHGVRPQLIVVSPFTRTLQTAHVMFGGDGTGSAPFLVHDLCRERWGKYTCDKRRTKTEIVRDMAPIFAATNDRIDFDSFGYETEDDEDWKKTREPDKMCTARGIAMMQWLATRPEDEIAVVTHSSWLKHLFRAFGETIHHKDKTTLHRLAGNAEVRSICLAMHKGFYPSGKWDGDTFIPDHPSFRKYRYAPTTQAIANYHMRLREEHTSEDREISAEMHY